MNTIQKLSHHNATRYNGDIEDWVEERSMSREEKIAFVDANYKLVSDWYCPLSVLLEVMNRYQEDIKSGKIKNYWVERPWDPKPEIVLNKNSYNSWVRKINKELGERVLVSTFLVRILTRTISVRFMVSNSASIFGMKL